MSSSRTCWTMCIEKACSPRASIGETSATRMTRQPASHAARRQPPAARGPSWAADGPPAAHVDPDEHARRGGSGPGRASSGDRRRPREPRGAIVAPGRGAPRRGRSRPVALAAAFRHLRPGRLGPVLHHLLSALAPPGCLACGAPPADPREVLCAAAAERCRGCAGRCCPRCALPAPAARAARAAGCARVAWAPLAHAGPAAALVHALKLRGALRAADAMAAADGRERAAAAAGGARPRPDPAPGRPSSCRCRPTPGAGGRGATTTPRGWPARSAGAPGWTSSDPAAGRRAAPAQVGASRAARLAAGRVPVAVVRPPAAAGRWCWSTTSRRPGRRSTRAPRRCAPRGSRRSWRSPTPGP